MKSEIREQFTKKGIFLYDPVSNPLRYTWERNIPSNIWVLTQMKSLMVWVWISLLHYDILGPQIYNGLPNWSDCIGIRKSETLLHLDRYSLWKWFNGDESYTPNDKAAGYTRQLLLGMQGKLDESTQQWEILTYFFQSKKELDKNKQGWRKIWKLYLIDWHRIFNTINTAQNFLFFTIKFQLPTEKTFIILFHQTETLILTWN